MQGVTRRRLPLVAIGAALAVASAACGSDDAGDDARGAESGPGGGVVAVDIASFSFDPETVEVAAGTTVRWTNRDRAAHTVRDDSGLGIAESGRLEQGDAFEITYADAGTYPYLCGIHQYMTATVVVEG